MKKLLLALALLAAAHTPALAQTPSPSHVQAAEELLGIIDVEKTTTEGMELMLKQQIQQNPAMARLEDIMREFVQKAMNWTELKPEYVRLYTDIYTEAELREMVAFYRTPLGKRMLDTLPQLMARSNEISQRRMQQHLPEMMRRMMERLSQPEKTTPKS